MKKSDLFTRIMLLAIVAAALFAVVLQILNDKTDPLETAYEILTFGVALLAVIMAVLQGMSNARTTRELSKITREIRELMTNVERDEQRDISLKREIKKDLELDRAAIEMIEKEQKP
jgi:septal ring factor EnvC (AmiA/AmiB activator)